jgi:hypothetical protein
MISQSRYEAFPMLICSALDVPADVVAILRVQDAERTYSRPSSSREDSTAASLSLASIVGFFPGAIQGVICG